MAIGLLAGAALFSLFSVASFQGSRYLRTDFGLDGTRKKNNHVHVLYGLSGNHSDFLGEFLVSFKSILLNAPLASDMTVHIMADQDAYNALDSTLDTTGIHSWRTRNQITIQTYNVESYTKCWEAFIESKLKRSARDAARVHTMGTFYRLFAHDVLHVDHVVYMDTDVAIMANPQD